MKLIHFALLLVVVAVWGINFVFIRLGLNGVPPILLCALRFTFVAIPAVFFLPKPKCSWKQLISYGLVMFAAQFSFLLISMSLGMPPGLASLLMQFQVFFTMFLAVIFFKEKISLLKIMGALISFSGILIVAAHTEGGVTYAGLFFVLLGAFSWGSGNIFSKKIGTTSPLALVVWGGLVASPALLLLSFWMEGPEKIHFALTNLSWVTILSISYTVYFSTHVAYSLWSFLLQTYPASMIAPFTLLVPVFGFLASMIAFGEPFPLWKMQAAILVILGLCLPFFEKRLKGIFRVVSQ